VVDETLHFGEGVGCSIFWCELVRVPCEVNVDVERGDGDVGGGGYGGHVG
jgi:hypothetical protein